MRYIGIIPARYASTRFPVKPLVVIHGKSMIQRVYEAAIKKLDNVVVATDDNRIFRHVESFDGKVVMTSEKHRSGTDRCVEALDKYSEKYSFSPDVVLNIQGDEPFLHSSHIELLCNCFLDASCQIATLIKSILNFEDLKNPNFPKVVLDKDNFALYFSRSIIPFQRNVEMQSWHTEHTYYKHIGLYGYKIEVLKEIAGLPQSALEVAEGLEQLRWLENGYKINVAHTDIETPSVDTPEDLEIILKNQKWFEK